MAYKEPNEAVNISFTPAIAGNWSVGIDKVSEALDDLASRVNQITIHTSGEISLANNATTTISHPSYANLVDVVGVRLTTENPADILLHFDGSDGSTTITDSGSGGWTWNATGASISTAQAKFGQSLLISPATDKVTSDSTNTTRSAGQSWTIDCWARPSSSSGLFRVFMDSSGDWQWLASGGTWYFAPNGSGISTGVAASADTWYHLEACCNGSSLYLFVNGTLVHSQAYSSSLGGTGRQWCVGNTSGLTSDINGYIDEIRLIWGTCAHTSTFTPATSAYPNSSFLKTALGVGSGFTAVTGSTGTTITNTTGSTMTCKFDVRGWS